MATAKLWWNGSSWSTSDVVATSKTSRTSSTPGVIAKIKLVAYDDFTLKLYASLQPDGQSGEGNSISGTFTVSYGGVSVAVSNSTGRSGDLRQAWSSATTTETGTISWTVGSSGIAGTYYRNGAKYYAKLWWDSSQSVTTSPFATITYNANGGSGAPAAHKVCKSISSSLSGAVPTRSGYTFLGWDTSSSAQTAVYQPSDTITTTANVTLYAVWQSSGGCRLDDGNNWIQAQIYVDNGVSWDAVQAYLDNGVSWELLS